MKIYEYRIVLEKRKMNKRTNKRPRRVILYVRYPRPWNGQLGGENESHGCRYGPSTYFKYVKILLTYLRIILTLTVKGLKMGEDLSLPYNPLLSTLRSICLPLFFLNRLRPTNGVFRDNQNRRWVSFCVVSPGRRELKRHYREVIILLLLYEQ